MTSQTPEYKVIKHYDNVYRVRLSEQPNRFGQIYRLGRKWDCEVREVETGKLVRFAGIWGTRRDAVDELVRLLDKMAKW